MKKLRDVVSVLFLVAGLINSTIGECLIDGSSEHHWELTEIIRLQCTSIDSSYGIVIRSNSNLERVFFPDLSSCTGSILVSDNPVLTSVIFPSLSTISASLTISSNLVVRVMEFSNLEYVENDVNIVQNGALQDFSFPNLESIYGSLTIQLNPILQSFAFRYLYKIMDHLTIQNNVQLYHVAFCDLGEIDGDKYINGNSALETINACGELYAYSAGSDGIPLICGLSNGDECFDIYGARRQPNHNRRRYPHFNHTHEVRHPHQSSTSTLNNAGEKMGDKISKEVAESRRKDDIFGEPKVVWIVIMCVLCCFFSLGAYVCRKKYFRTKVTVEMGSC